MTMAIAANANALQNNASATTCRSSTASTQYAPAPPLGGAAPRSARAQPCPLDPPLCRYTAFRVSHWVEALRAQTDKLGGHSCHYTVVHSTTASRHSNFKPHLPIQLQWQLFRVLTSARSPTGKQSLTVRGAAAKPSLALRPQDMNRLVTGAYGHSLLLHWMRRNFPEGFLVVDPTGDLALALADTIPPSQIQRTFLFEPGDRSHSAVYNIFNGAPRSGHHTIAQFCAVFDAIFPEGATTLTRMNASFILQLSLRTLLEKRDATLLELIKSFESLITEMGSCLGQWTRKFVPVGPMLMSDRARISNTIPTPVPRSSRNLAG